MKLLRLLPIISEVLYENNPNNLDVRMYVKYKEIIDRFFKKPHPVVNTEKNSCAILDFSVVFASTEKIKIKCSIIEQEKEISFFYIRITPVFTKSGFKMDFSEILDRVSDTKSLYVFVKFISENEEWIKKKMNSMLLTDLEDLMWVAK